MGVSNACSSLGSIHYELLADEGSGKLKSKKNADSLGNAEPKTGDADQPKPAPPVRNLSLGKSHRVSKQERQNPKSGTEATEVSSSFESSAVSSSDPAKQVPANDDDASIGPQAEGSQSEKIGEQSGSEAPVSEGNSLGSNISDDLAVHSVEFSDQAFDAIAERVTQRDEVEDGGTPDHLTEDDDFAGIQDPGTPVEAAKEDDQYVSANFGSHSSPGASARNIDAPEVTPAVQKPIETQTEDNSKQGRRTAARILAIGLLASACIFASEQFGATVWLTEGVQKIRAQFSRPALSPKIQPINGHGSSIEIVGDGKARAVEVGFGPGDDQETISDLDWAFRTAEYIESAPSADQSTGNANSSTAFSSDVDGEVSSTPSAGRLVSERTDASSLVPSKDNSIRDAHSDNGIPDDADEPATAEIESELVLANDAKSEDMRAFSLDAAVAERNFNAAIPFHTASAFSSSVAHSSHEQALFEAADDAEESLGDPRKVGILNNSTGCGLSEKPKEFAQQSSLSWDNQSGSNEYAAPPLFDEISSFGPMPDASGEAASTTVCGSIFDDGDCPSFAELNSLRSELELEFAGIHSKLDLLAARLNHLFAGLEPSSAFHGGANDTGNPLLEIRDDANIARGMNCRHPPNHSGQNCEAASRTGKSSQPYLIATALNAEDGEFSMPELGYGVVLDVLKDSAGGWLIVMENATLRLD